MVGLCECDNVRVENFKAFNKTLLVSTFGLMIRFLFIFLASVRTRISQ